MWDVPMRGSLRHGPCLTPVLSWSVRRRMNKPAGDPAQPYRTLIAVYTDNIRAADFKANIAILFVAFMMGPILYNYTKFPSYLPINFVLLPFLIVYLCLFMVLIPRYPRRGSKNFIVSRTASAAD